MKTLQAAKLGTHFYSLSMGQSHGILLQLTYCLLVFCLMLFSFTHHSIQHYLHNNLGQMLGAEGVITMSRPMESVHQQELNSLVDEMSVTRQVSLTMTNKDLWQRAQLKVVEGNYPLQGQLVYSQKLTSEEVKTKTLPAEGEIWLDPRLLRGLEVEIGQAVILHGREFVVSGVLHHEPDRLMEGHSVEMRALIGPQSFNLDWQDYHVNYRYLLNYDSASSDSIENLVKQNLPDASFIHKQGQHPLATFWKRSENFLGLSSVLLFLLGALAIDLISRKALAAKSLRFALLKSMGTGNREGLTVLLSEWLCLFAGAIVIGGACAWLVQGVILQELAAFMPGISSQMSWSGAASLAAMLAMLFALFQLPGWLSLTAVSISHLLKNEAMLLSKGMRILCSVSGIALICVMYTDNPLLTAMTLGALACVTIIVCLLTWVSLSLGARLTARSQGLLPFCLFIMKQRMVSKTAQILGVGLCACLMLFTFMLMRDIGQTMEVYQRSQDGNFFVTRLQSEDVARLKSWSDSTQSDVRQLKPFYSGSVVAVNNVPLKDLAGPPSESKSRLERPVRVHTTDDVPVNNRVLDGQWWTQDRHNWQQVSVEEEVMQDVGLSLGDTLTISFGGKQLDFVIRASHVFKPGQGSITFWFQVPSAAAQHIDTQEYVMGSMEIPQQNWSQLVNLWQSIPSMRAISLKELTANFDATLSAVKAGVSGFSLMIALMGVLVILAAVNGFEDTDKRKNGLLLSFGKTKGECLKLTMYEWLITALIAAVGAIAGTWVFGSLIYQSQFSMNYSPDFAWLGITLLTILSLVCVVGLAACRNSLNIDIKTLIQSA